MKKFRNAFVARYTTTENLQYFKGFEYLTGVGVFMSRNREHAEREAKRLANIDLSEKINKHWEGMGGAPIMDTATLTRGENRISHEWF